MSKFIPCTREVAIGRGVVYRPLRAWHAGVYAGERLTSVRGDASGCVRSVGTGNQQQIMCDPPSTVVHRLYWNVADPQQRISAFLSYPQGMGYEDEYFWEAYVGDEPQRWRGDEAETEMEAEILAAIGDAVAP